MFIGREKELELLKNELESQNKSIIFIYGKQRIGKSALISESTKYFDGIVLNHLCVKLTYEENLALLSSILSSRVKMQVWILICNP